MPRKIITPLVVVSLFVGALIYAASGRDYDHYADYDSSLLAPQKSSERRMVDMTADDSYLIEKGDSTIFILVGNFAAHHNGTVILADSAVRYSNQSFVCFGDVLINQNDTYAYGDRAEYNRNNSTATIYSDLIKVVDGEAVMYTYHCTFNSSSNMGHFYGGCYVEKGESLLEAERGYYNTDTHDLIAVDRVEMRDEKYLMTGDSVIFNTQTEDARYFTNTNIWNDKDEYLFANEGSYTKASDLHYLTRDAYILSPEREIWSDTIEYYRTEGHIIGRRNIQMDDTTQKVLGFADYGEWWDEPGNALFTRRPSMINYDPTQPDSLFLSADTLWMYTIAVPPPPRPVADSLAEVRDTLANGDMADTATMPDVEVPESGVESAAEDVAEVTVADSVKGAEPSLPEKPVAAGTVAGRELPKPGGDMPRERDTRRTETAVESATTTEVPSVENEAEIVRDSVAVDSVAVDSVVTDSLTVDSLTVDSLTVDSIAMDTVARDTVPLTKRQLRYRAKMEKRRVRDSVRAAEKVVRDSIDAIIQAELDSVQHIRDSLFKIKIDSIVAKRIEKSSRLADEEAARLARIKQKAEERERRKIDKAKARALRRGKEYKGKDYTLDTLAQDTLAADSLRNERDTLGRDTLAVDSLADSLARDSIAERPFPEDSVYKMIKAYRRVKMYRSDSQIVCDSLTLMNTDSIIRLYIDPVLWQETNQITADSMAIHTRNELLHKAHFMGDPIMGSEIDTAYYNQVKGKDMIAYFEDGSVYRNDVNGNAQTIYYMQGEDDPEVTGMMYIESAAISFYLVDGTIDKIAYKQNPEYVLYPIGMVPETQVRKLPDFEWHSDRRPLRDSVCDREIRATRREDASTRHKPHFRITERINYDRRRLVENRMWEDRVDELTPEVIEWRNSRPSYQKRR
ncbi:MAG: hypothetical protein IJX40_01060 [Alistipes sp.]|nr:hypothetical protein [Alistipes sp.]